MLVIGLTGGIGSGKSTVARLFAAKGIPVIEADHIARELTQPGKPAFLAIVQHFGPTVLQPDETLNRARLRKLVFADDNARHWLEGLLHPLIKQEIEAQVKTFTAPYCIAVIPLLFETEPYPYLSRILVIDSPENLQISRVEARDGVSPEDINSILKTQLSRQERLTKAHDVLTNAGDLAELKAEVERLHQFYLSLANA